MPEPKNLPARFTRERIGETVTFTGESLAGMYRDPKIREAAQGSLRLLINAGITVVDLVPIAGESMSIAHKIVKGIHRAKYIYEFYRHQIEKKVKKYERRLVSAQEKAQQSGHETVALEIQRVLDKLKLAQKKVEEIEAKLQKWSIIDPSKDVPFWASILIDVPDLATGGALPTHAIETAWQGFKDFPAIIGGTKAFFRRLIAMGKGEQYDFQQNQPTIAEAAGEFGVDFSDVEVVEYHNEDEGGSHE